MEIWKHPAGTPQRERLIQHAYDAAGQLGALTDDAISAAAFTYQRDARYGSVSGISTPRGQQSGITRDSLGQITHLPTASPTAANSLPGKLIKTILTLGI